MSLLEDCRLSDPGTQVGDPPAIGDGDEARRSRFAASPAAANRRAAMTDLGLVLATVSVLAAVLGFSGVAAATPGIVSVVFAVAVAGVVIVCSLRIARVC